MSHTLMPVRTAAPAPVVSLEETKRRLRVEHSEDDALITALVAAATEHFDGWSGVLGRALGTQSWRQDYCGFSACMRLPLAPAASVTSVVYFDAENAAQTLDDSTYVLLADAIGPFVRLKPDQTWPSSYDRPDAVSITFVAGTASIAEPIRTAIIMLAGHLYEHREAVGPDALSEIPFGVQALVAPYRRIGV